MATSSPAVLLLRLRPLTPFPKLGSLRTNVTYSRSISDKTPFGALSRFPLKPTGRNRNGNRNSIFTCFFDAKDKLDQPDSSSQKNEEGGLAILRRWDVPWDWPTIFLTMFACALSFLLTGFIEAQLLPYLGLQGSEATLEDKAEALFIGQFSVTAVILTVIYSITDRFKPYSDEIFRYDLKEPFNLQKGWIVWTGFGLFNAVVLIGIVGLITGLLNGEPPQRDPDALSRLLPLIGSSTVNTACLLGITGVLAPILEETIFRGFLMVSLTKWVPTPVAVVISAATFALAHFTPSEFPQLFILGAVLGFTYCQTRNLMTPIMIHAFWNSGVLLLLTFLQLQGYDIKELIKAN
ncbi:hypothetical protein LUZ60_003101 [Juncus effusus]|nr:hypothetical protein LUZ60_003101 [Juncus effusus]